jgi:hypothetical protein
LLLADLDRDGEEILIRETEADERVRGAAFAERLDEEPRGVELPQIERFVVVRGRVLVHRLVREVPDVADRDERRRDLRDGQDRLIDRPLALIGRTNEEPRRDRDSSHERGENPRIFSRRRMAPWYASWAESEVRSQKSESRRPHPAAGVYG